MRGIAAIGVLLAHLGAWTNHHWIAPYGYLAVDFFFCLSGFVVAAAYKQRAQNGMSLWQFTKVRLVRLYPLIFVGLVLGFTFYSTMATFHKLKGVSLKEVLFAANANLFLLPYLKITGMGDNAFPLNVVQWSLFFELLINFMWFLSRRLLRPVVVATAMAVSLLIVIWGQHKGFDIGFMGAANSSFWYGIPRTIYSFGAGLLINEWRSTRSANQKWSCSCEVVFIPLGVLLCMPAVENVHAFELLCTAFLFPLLLLLATQAYVSPGLSIFCSFGEKISYPVYAIHRPLYFIAIAALSFGGVKRPHFLISCVIVGVITCLAWLVGMFVDVPVRRYLEKKLGLRPSRHDHTPDAGMRDFPPQHCDTN